MKQEYICLVIGLTDNAVRLCAIHWGSDGPLLVHEAGTKQQHAVAYRNHLEEV